MPDWLQSHSLLGIPMLQWLQALALAVGGFAVAYTVLRVVASRLRRIAGRHPNPVLDAVATALEGTRKFLLMLLFVLVGARMLEPLSDWSAGIGYTVFAIAAIQLGLWLNRAVAAWTRHRLDDDHRRNGNPVVMTMLGWFARTAVWATLLLAILANAGVDITAFVASLGVGGVAVALALQNVLGDLFASLSIGLDKPFVIDDFIVFGDIAGTIERVGVKTTRIRSLSGEEIIVGNAELLKHIVHNYGRMRRRRIVFGFGVTYDTPRDRLRSIPDMVRSIADDIDLVTLDRIHFKSFGDSSLDFEMVYYVEDPDYTRYMDAQQKINLALVERFDRESVEFAFPSRTLYVAGTPKLRLETAPDASDTAR